MTIEGEGTTVEYDFVDPDPGYATVPGEEGDVISVTVRTFAVPLEPGEYTITDIWVDDGSLYDEPTVLPMVLGDSERVLPRFSVIGYEPCTFIGEITSITVRLPPGDAAEQVEFAEEFLHGIEAVLTFNSEGSLLGLDLGSKLLDDIIDGDFSGHSWWLGGELVDERQCVTQEATFAADE
jgi:hypothetical protein